MLANLIDFHDKVSSFSLSKRGHCCNTNLLVAIKQQISYWLRYTVHSNFNKFHPYKICMCISPGCVRCWCWVRDPVVLCCSGWSQKSVRHRSQQYGHPLSGEECGQQWLVSERGIIFTYDSLSMKNQIVKTCIVMQPLAKIIRLFIGFLSLTHNCFLFKDSGSTKQNVWQDCGGAGEGGGCWDPRGCRHHYIRAHGLHAIQWENAGDFPPCQEMAQTWR